MKRLLLICILFPHLAFSQIFVNVNATGANDGTSWRNAYTHLQKAINHANTGEQLWVAKGTYFCKDVANGEDHHWRDVFYIDKDIEIYGGFEGNEVALAARDPEVHPTILTGRFTYREETFQSNTVLRIHEVSNACILDGLVIQYGNATQGSEKTAGGVINESLQANSQSSPTIKNCIIRDNYARYGGGWVNHANDGGMTAPVFSNTVFVNNEADEIGGAVYNRVGNNSYNYSVFTDCNFVDNRAEEGAATYNVVENGDMQSVHYACYFQGNRAQDGAGVFNYADGNRGVLKTIINNCTFYSNHSLSGSGGAMYNYSRGNSSLVTDILSTTFKRNTANRKGGAIYTMNIGATYEGKLQASKFEENSAEKGGALYNYDSYGEMKVEINSNVFFKNHANDEGGAIFNRSRSDYTCTITNATFAKNTAYDEASALMNEADVDNKIDLSIYNSIIWDDKDGEDMIDGDGDFSFKMSNNIIKGDELPDEVIELEPNYLNYDPMFVDIESGNLALQLCSPAINTSVATHDVSEESEETAPSEEDSSGGSRAVGVKDIGAVENQIERTLLEEPRSLFQANYEFTDPKGWTHYMDCDNNVLLLSLKKGNQNIGSIGDGQFKVEILTTPNYKSGLGTDISNASYVSSSSVYAMNRYWNVKATHQPNNPIAVRFYFSEQDIEEMLASAGHITQLEDIYFFKLDNNSDPQSMEANIFDYNEYAYSSAEPSLDTWSKGSYQGFTFAEYYVKNFSGGGANTGASLSAMPVELSKFYGIAKKSAVALKWQTETESNSKGFEVRHQNNFNGTWETIGFVNSRGESVNRAYYEFEHKRVLSGTQYYQLKAIDWDGKYEFSEIIAVEVEDDGDLTKLFPNPVTTGGTLKFTFERKKIDALFIYNNQGIEVYRDMDIGEYENEIQLSSDLKIGNYVILFVSDKKRVMRQFSIQE